VLQPIRLRLLLRDRWLQEIHPTASAGLGENERENEPAKHALSIAKLRRMARILTRIASGGRAVGPASPLEQASAATESARAAARYETEAQVSEGLPNCMAG
jgi:hypothetical protein